MTLPRRVFHGSAASPPELLSAAKSVKKGPGTYWIVGGFFVDYLSWLLASVCDERLFASAQENNPPAQIWWTYISGVGGVGA